MRLKSELYKVEQEEIVDEIINILSLESTNKITLYELDQNIEKQTKIMELIPKIRKYYSFNNIKAVGEPYKIKRPWLSIIKQLTKSRYKITSKDFRYKSKKNKSIRTKIYSFEI